MTWAQRSNASEKEKNHIFLTISVPDVSKEKITLDLQPNSLNFQGYSETKKATYAVKLDFYAEIDPQGSKINHTPRDVEMVIQKKELNSEYWPRLLKHKAKVHFLKTDFDKVRISRSCPGSAFIAVFKYGTNIGTVGRRRRAGRNPR